MVIQWYWGSLEAERRHKLLTAALTKIKSGNLHSLSIKEQFGGSFKHIHVKYLLSIKLCAKI